ncbi:hypothetical protein BG262_00510 [Floricoccus penangensis]|uniref:EAL domain-containing protein n=1 Tax=Floricoccus penangensis TaxID=1859475 RepID=A0A9Q5P0V3_9LACT|nr:EAL domain-containing protein [Floricoccus penangensis]OFI48017.1 hypothetical protein BG262_00510 [Floricoccus penangensis]
MNIFDDLYLLFQPIVNTESTMDFNEFEILLRTHETNSFPESLFTRLMNDEGLYINYLDWFHKEIKKNMDAFPKYNFSLNLFPNQITKEATWKFLNELKSYSSQIMIEITEHIKPFQKQVDHMNNQIDMESYLIKMRGLGYQVALDDISTGQNNLEFVLNNIEHIDTMKFTLTAFMDAQMEDVKDFIYAWKHVAMRHGKRFIVEGVENEEISKRLSDSGFTYQQGYYWPFIKDMC